jgi:Cu2+-containing amine oxidase
VYQRCIKLAQDSIGPEEPAIACCAGCLHVHPLLPTGDYGLGFGANSLALGCDCLGEVHYFDGVVNDAAGQPVVIKNAVCLHEEDAGLLWKHLDYR